MLVFIKETVLKVKKTIIFPRNTNRCYKYKKINEIINIF